MEAGRDRLLQWLLGWPGSSGVERGPEKAGVGGSNPSLATIPKILDQQPLSLISSLSSALLYCSCRKMPATHPYFSCRWLAFETDFLAGLQKRPNLLQAHPA
jgi:hypothetical protein